MVEKLQNHLQTWLGKDPKGRDYMVGAGHSLTISTEEWKYIEPGNGIPYQVLTNTELGNNPEDQLYNIQKDRGEYDNVAGENPLIVRFLKQLLDEEKEKDVEMEL